MTCGFLVSRAVLVGRHDTPVVTLAGVVLLKEPVPVTESKHALVFKLSPSVEVAARTAATAGGCGGGTLNTHFSAFVGTAWRAWLLNAKQAAAVAVFGIHSNVDTHIYAHYVL